MPIINLKQQYPHLYDEILLDVSDPIFEVYDLSRKGENNYDRRRRYHHAYFSLDAGDGIENCATYRTPSPEEIWMQKIGKEQLREALEHLSVVQSRRVYAYYIHDPQKEQENVHAHILLTLRPFKTNGEWNAKCRKEYDLDGRGQRIPDGKGGWKNHRVNLTDWNEQTKAEEWRASWAMMTNAALERNGLSERVDHRSYKRQGTEQIPTIHMGVAASQMEKRGIVTEKGTVNREIAKQNRLLKEIKARLTRLYNWSKAQDDAAADQPSIRELLQQAQQTLEETAQSTRYGKVHALKESALLFAFLQSNGIRSMPELHEKINAMQSDYYALRGEIVKAEKDIAQRKEHLTQWERYTENRNVVKRISTLRPKAQERERENHSAEIILYDAAVRYLSALKESGAKLTPKRWKAEIAELTASKDAKYQQMYAMREQIKAAESIRKAAEKLEKQLHEPHQPHRSESELQK